MNIPRLAATGWTLLIVAGCADGGNPSGPADLELSRDGSAPRPARPARATQRVPATGSFQALVDFSTLTLTPRGRNCLLVVNGRLVFSGTIAGVANGTTRALVFAPCEHVATTPPGTFRDVFRSELVFEGTVDGEPARAKVLYTGGVEPGGEIDGRLIFSRGIRGRLQADAVVAVGGTYRGAVVVN